MKFENCIYSILEFLNHIKINSLIVITIFQKDVFMHLTNYAIQKRSDEFIRDEESGTKRYKKKWTK